MPSTPRVQDLSDEIVSGLQISLSQSIPIFPKAFIRVLAKVLAAGQILLYKYCGFILLQLFVAHASFREITVAGRTFIPLVELGRLFGAGDPNAPTRGQHTLTVTVNSQTDSLAAGSLLLHPPTGVLHQVITAVELNAATVAITVRAVSDQIGGDGSGTIGNLEVGDELEFANPIPYVNRVAVVASQTVTGAAGETETAYRARVLRRCQAKPQGGAYADYQEWGESVSGIVGVYPYSGDPGEVDVYVEANTDSDPDGIPTAPQLAAVHEAIQLTEDGRATRRPVNAAINTLPITRTAFDIVVTGLAAEDLAALETLVEDTADEYFRSRKPFIEGLSVLPRLNRVTAGELFGLIVGVVSSVGGAVNNVEMQRGGLTLIVWDLQYGETAKLGTTTYL